MKGVLRVRLQYGEWRRAMKGSLRMIPAHDKHGVRTRTLLTDIRCVCEAMRSLGASLFSLLNAT